MSDRTAEVRQSSVYVHYHRNSSLLSVYSNYAPKPMAAAPALKPCDFRDLNAASTSGLIEVVNDAIEQSAGERPLTAANATDVRFLFGHDLFGKGGQPIIPMNTASKKFVFSDTMKPVALPLVANGIRGPPGAPPTVPFLATWQISPQRDTSLFFPIAGSDHEAFERLTDLSKVSLQGKRFVVAATDLGEAFTHEAHKLVPEMIPFDRADALLVPSAVTVLIGHSPDCIKLEVGDNTGKFTTIDELAKAALARKAILVAVTCKSAAAQAAVGVFDEFEPLKALDGYRKATKDRDLLTFLDTFAAGVPNAEDGNAIRLLLKGY